MRKLILIIGACLVLVVVGCGSDDSTTSSGEEGAVKQADPGATKTKPTVTVPEGEPSKSAKLISKDLEEGTGKTAKAGDAVTVQYVGVNYRSGKEFDSSWDRGEPFTFTLGKGEVIAGWDQGIEGMKVGGRRELIIPPELGYGAVGHPQAIPPNETLIFIVDLEAVE